MLKSDRHITYHTMAKTEKLLQELVDLKKKEMLRTRINRIIKFLFVTLPVLILIGVSIYGTVLLYEKGEDLIEDLPTIIEDMMQSQIGL